MTSIYPQDINLLGELKTITVRPFHFEIKDNFRNRGSQSILFWVKDQNSVTHLLRINEFPVYVCLELPKYDSETQEYIPWSHDLANRVYEYFSWCMTAKKLDKPIDFRFEKKNDIYDFSPIKKSYIYFFFSNEASKWATLKMCELVRNITGVGHLKFTGHEKKVNSLRRLMSLRNCSYSQWFTVEGRGVAYEYDDRASVKSITEFFIDWRTIDPIDPSISQNWIVNPSYLAFDIETYSDNHRSMPSMYNLKHVVYLFSAIYEVLNRPETRKEYCVVFGECNPVEGVVIIKVNSELEGLLAFTNLIIDLDPDIVSGYNIFGYDWPYIIGRFKIHLTKMPNMSRILREEIKIYDNPWESKGYGKNDVTFPIMSGRIPLDLYPNIKRLFKLRMYTLDFVSKEFLGRGKHDITAKQMFGIYEKSLLRQDDGSHYPENVAAMTKVVEYCIVDSVLVVDVFSKTNLWHHLVELSSVAGVPILDLFTRGEQIRCYSQISHQCYLRGFVLSSGKHYDYFYSGGHVDNPNINLWDLVLTFDFSSLYPSIMQAYNLCYTTFIPEDLWATVPKEDCNCIEFDQEEPSNYKSVSRGDDNLEETAIISEKDEVIIDSSMIIRHYEFRFVKKHIRVGIMPYLEEQWVADRKKVKNELKIVEKQMDKMKKEMGEMEDGDEKIAIKKNYRELEITAVVLDKRQAAIKVLANSGYGFTGVRNGYLPGLPIAMCTTAMGRRLIGEANQFIVKNYAHYEAHLVYGDTDSCMISVNPPKDKSWLEIGDEIAEAISGKPAKTLPDGTIIPAVPGIFPDPLKMEFEDCSRILCLKKKMYAKVKRNFRTGDFERDEHGKLKISPKGILTSKKGKNKFSMMIYSDALLQIMSRDNVVNTLRTLKNHFMTLMRGELNPREKLTMVSELGSDYKQEWYEMNLFSNFLSQMGHPVKPGDRLEYLIIRLPQEDENVILKAKDKHKIYKGNKMREITMWEQDPNREEVDYLYYIEKGLMDPFDYMFSVGFKQICMDPRFQTVGYKPMFSNCHFTHFSSPIKMIVAFVEDVMKANDSQLSRLTSINLNQKKILIVAQLIDTFVEQVCSYLEQFI